MVLLNLFTLKNETKNYKNRTSTCSHDGVLGTRFTLIHWKTREKTQYMKKRTFRYLTVGKAEQIH